MEVNVHAIVCIKQVPDTQEIQVDFAAGVIKRDGAVLIVNPFDEYAIEEAVSHKEKNGGTVTAVTMGPAAADEALRTALAMGCDAAVLLQDAAFDRADTWVTAVVLAQAIKKLAPADVICFGKSSFDGDTGQVGPRVAALLGLPMLSYVAKIINLDVAAKTITVERLLEDGRDVVRAPLPSVLSFVKEINTPRYPSMLGIRKAKKIEIPVWDAGALGLSPPDVDPLLSVNRIYSPPGRAAGELIPGEPAEAAKSCVNKLAAEGLL